MGVRFAKIEIDVLDMGHITNTYLIYDENTKNGILVDPADKPEYIMEKLNALKVTLKKICLTHCHFDHIGALEEIYKKTKAKIYIHEKDKDGIFDNDKNCSYITDMKKTCSLNKNNIIGIEDKEKIELDEINLEVIHTPGHTDGSIVLYLRNLDILFTGDTVFADCYGRTDLKSGSEMDMMKSLDKIFSRFNNLEIYPGHGKACNIEEAKRKIHLIMAMKGIEG